MPASELQPPRAVCRQGCGSITPQHSGFARAGGIWREHQKASSHLRGRNVGSKRAAETGGLVCRFFRGKTPALGTSNSTSRHMKNETTKTPPGSSHVLAEPSASISLSGSSLIRLSTPARREPCSGWVSWGHFGLPRVGKVAAPEAAEIRAAVLAPSCGSDPWHSISQNPPVCVLQLSLVVLRLSSPRWVVPSLEGAHHSYKHTPSSTKTCLLIFFFFVTLGHEY